MRYDVWLAGGAAAPMAADVPHCNNDFAGRDARDHFEIWRRPVSSAAGRNLRTKRPSYSLQKSL